MSGRWVIRVATLAALAVGAASLNLFSAWAAEPLPAAQATDRGSHSSALGTRDTVMVSESTASADKTEWSALTVAGTSVIGRNESGWTGEAADAGKAIDAVNGHCLFGACVQVLGGGAYQSGSPSDHNGWGVSRSAGGYIASVSVASGYAVTVLPSNAHNTTYACGGWSGSASLVTVNGQPGLGLTETTTGPADWDGC